METFYRDLLHEKVSKKISLKASKSEGQLFAGILCPEKHPSKCDSKDFFWIKVKAKHTIKQVADAYRERTGVRVILSDGDSVLNNKARMHDLNHFQDDLVVLWAQDFQGSSSSTCKDDAERDSKLAASIAQSLSAANSKDTSIFTKRRLGSPSEPEPKRNKKAQSVPLAVGDHAGVMTDHADITTRRPFSSGPANSPLRRSAISQVQGQSSIRIEDESFGEPLSPIAPACDTLPISPPATVFTPDFMEELSYHKGEADEPQSLEAANSNTSKETTSLKGKALKNTDIRKWMPRNLENRPLTP